MSVRKSLFISFAEKYAVLVISIASTMVLARLLSPAEIGVFSVSVAVIGVAQMLRDFGVTQYLIVEKDLTRDRIRTAFGITIVISWTIGGVMFLFAGTLADFYDEPALRTTISVLCINFLLIPFGNPVLSLLRRDMAFGKLFWINTATSVVREATAVSLAFSGFGFMSLVWGSLAGVVTTVVLATICRPSAAWVIPGFREWRRVLSFGVPASATALVTELGTNAGDLVIGKVLGFSEVGFYSRALGLINLFQQNIMSAVRWVSLPVFAANQRSGGDLRESYLQSVSLVTVVAWPFFAFVGIMAFPIVRFLFGDQWDVSIELARYLAVAGAIGGLWTLAGQVLMSVGRVRDVFYCEAIIQAVRIGLILAAVFHSLAMVAASQILTYATGFFVFQFYLKRHVGVGLFDVLRAAAPSLAVTLIAVTGPIGVIAVMGVRSEEILLTLCAGSVALGAGWMAAVFGLRHPIAKEVNQLLSAAFRKVAGRVQKR